MSELSPGSKATTNLFIILGVIALAALAWSVGTKPTTDQKNCTDRLITMGTISAPNGANPSLPDASLIVMVQFTVLQDGTIKNIELLDPAAEYAELVNQAISTARYSEVADAAPLTCQYSFTIEP